ncbi:MAG: class I SAM-dependent methyltransferase [Pseudanabaenaceae cyanobacterium bins.39]|nr:class I SAM-dependent methyltransferase [Pseudanabaenaceae cyanobacterium bins.39]
MSFNTDNEKVRESVATLYNAYPFPPEPILDEPPPGYNWRWNWQAAHNFCTGFRPSKQDIRILDAGCGSGVSTEYLVHLNPHASVVGIDISEGTLAVAKERCQRSGASRVEFHHLSLFDADRLEGEFDLINSVGVLHHTADPIRGIQALAKKLSPGGLLHIFVYSELGRWEIRLMQEAIALLQGDRRGDYRDGVRVGREIFATLPDTNCLRRREMERWAMENQQDACFADMYVHPQEIDYNIYSLFELIDASGLEFLGFSNPQVWDLERLLGKVPDLMARSQNLSERELYRLIEVLDPHTISHYEFFLGRPPLVRQNWQSDRDLLAAIPEPSPCIYGWQESPSFFDYNYQIAKITDQQWQFLLAAANNPSAAHTVAQILASVNINLDEVRSLQKMQIITLL